MLTFEPPPPPAQRASPAVSMVPHHSGYADPVRFGSTLSYVQPDGAGAEPLVEGHPALHYYALDLPSKNVIGLFNTAGGLMPPASPIGSSLRKRPRNALSRGDRQARLVVAAGVTTIAKGTEVDWHNFARGAGQVSYELAKLTPAGVAFSGVERKGNMGKATIVAVVGSLAVIAWSLVAIARELRRPGEPDRDALLIDTGIIAAVAVIPLTTAVMPSFPILGGLGSILCLVVGAYCFTQSSRWPR